ncbi:putative disease resistance protein At1g59620 [Nicotiana tabacum]|uniref:Disease resistance protein At1g59620 n=1 Tax=Nicotiana tabacum TaxID=4097 RepID=A0AC58U371_TOBAC
MIKLTVIKPTPTVLYGIKTLKFVELWNASKIAPFSFPGLIETLEKLLNQDSCLFPEKRATFEALYSEVSSLQAFIQLPSATKPEMRIWERLIRDVAYKAEYAIELCLCTSHINRSGENEGNAHMISVYGLQELLREISSVNKKLKTINPFAHGTKDFQAGESLLGNSSEQASHQENRFWDFNDHLERIRCRLFRLSPELNIVPIVGMGEIGKTALARASYNDPCLVNRFDIHAWITVFPTVSG